MAEKWNIEKLFWSSYSRSACHRRVLIASRGAIYVLINQTVVSGVFFFFTHKSRGIINGESSPSQSSRPWKMHPTVVETIFYIYDYNFSALTIVKRYARNGCEFAPNIYFIPRENVNKYNKENAYIKKHTLA